MQAHGEQATSAQKPLRCEATDQFSLFFACRNLRNFDKIYVYCATFSEAENVLFYCILSAIESIVTVYYKIKLQNNVLSSSK